MIDLKTGPLEELAELVFTPYLSDLQVMEYETIRTELRSMDPHKYPLFQWKDAVKYLTGESTDLETVQEIYDYLLAYKRTRKIPKIN